MEQRLAVSHSIETLGKFSFFHTCPKLLSDRPSQQPHPAHLTPTLPAAEDSFVLDDNGNLADGHGNNYVALDAEDCRQADPTWTRQPGGRQLLPAVPSEYLDKIRSNIRNLDSLSLPQIFDHLFRQPSSTVTPEDMDK